MQIRVVAKSVILNPNGAVLLMRRSQTDTRRPGEWDFPGGIIEPGEDMAAGAAREISEESGLQVAPERLMLLYAATESYKGEVSVTRLLFMASVDTDAVQLSFEHDHYKWVDIDTALTDFPHPFYGVGLRYARDNALLS